MGKKFQRNLHRRNHSGKPVTEGGKSPAQLRLSCVQLLHKMQQGGGSLPRLLPAVQQQLALEDRAQLHAWAYGYCRWAHELRGLVDQLLDKPLKAKDADVYLLIQLGVFQLRHTPTVDHAAVDETVKVARLLKKDWAGGLVNAVLRNYQRQQAELEHNLSDAARHSHPDWLTRLFKIDWPEHWQQICAANNQQGPMTLRVNRLQNTPQHYQLLLAENDLQSTLDAELPDALFLDNPVPVERLPGFAQGRVSVQDGAAQLAAGYIKAHSQQGARVLDACAAPGGKTAHIIEQQRSSSVLALDKDPERLQRVTETLQRLNTLSDAVLVAADAADLEQWWDGQCFEAVLLDAPCSGTGVIRRPPDIKLLRRESDIAELVRAQTVLLDALWKTVTPSGLLLYATCSVLKKENEQQVEAFLTRTPDAKLLDKPRQILPGECGMDGFFYAPLGKASA